MRRKHVERERPSVSLTLLYASQPPTSPSSCLPDHSADRSNDVDAALGLLRHPVPRLPIAVVCSSPDLGYERHDFLFSGTGVSRNLSASASRRDAAYSSQRPPKQHGPLRAVLQYVSKSTILLSSELDADRAVQRPSDDGTAWLADVALAICGHGSERIMTRLVDVVSQRHEKDTKIGIASVRE